jgi:hypothetical protein
MRDEDSEDMCVEINQEKAEMAEREGIFSKNNKN